MNMPNPKNNQEVFDYVWDALKKQGRGSYKLGWRIECLYRGPNNTKCALGHLIPDYKYRTCNEGMAARTISCLDIYDENLLSRMQSAHDQSCKTECFMDTLQDKFSEIAKDFALKFNP